MTKENHPQAQEFGELFIEASKPQFRTQANLARALGVSKTHITNIKEGKKVPSVNIFIDFIDLNRGNDPALSQLIPMYACLLKRAWHVRFPIMVHRLLNQAQIEKQLSLRGKNSNFKKLL